MARRPSSGHWAAAFLLLAACSPDQTPAGSRRRQHHGHDAVCRDHHVRVVQHRLRYRIPRLRAAGSPRAARSTLLPSPLNPVGPGSWVVTVADKQGHSTHDQWILHIMHHQFSNCSANVHLRLTLRARTNC